MKPFYVRELTTYPVGSRRILLLSIAVLASLIANFETTLATILPMLLKDLRMTLPEYGLIAAVSVLVAGVSAAFGGVLSDRWGRVTLLVPTLTLTGACNFLLATVETVNGLFWVRCLMLLIEGAGITITASLVRDFSPRMGRAQAFGFWTWGPVGASFIASALAFVTLPLFGGHWQSQAIIMGVVSLVMCAIVIWKIAEPSAALRAQVMASESREITTGSIQAEERIDSAKVRELFRHGHLWAHVGGNTAWQILYFTLAIFGQTLLVDSFAMDTATANGVVALGVVLNAITVISVGRISDRLQLRKPFVFGGILLTLVTLGYLISILGRPVSTGHVIVVWGLLFFCLGVAYVPWMANFSENAEDVQPALQGAALGIWGMAVRVMVVFLLVGAPLMAEGGNWSSWLMVSAAGQVVALLCVAAYKGHWSRAAVLAEERSVA